MERVNGFHLQRWHEKAASECDSGPAADDEEQDTAGCDDDIPPLPPPMPTLEELNKLKKASQICAHKVWAANSNIMIIARKFIVTTTQVFNSYSEVKLLGHHQLGLLIHL